MAYLGRDGDGVHPPIPATHLAQRLSACALLWLAERGGPCAMGAYSGASGLDRSNPARSHCQPGIALSSLRRPVGLDGHADPRSSLTPSMSIIAHCLRSGVRPKAGENVSARILSSRQNPSCSWPRACRDRVWFQTKFTTAELQNDLALVPPCFFLIAPAAPDESDPPQRCGRRSPTKSKSQRERIHVPPGSFNAA